MSLIDPTPRRARAASLFAALALLLPIAAYETTAQERVAREDVSPKDKAAKAAEAVAVDVYFNDDSHLKVKLRDDKIELITPYGKLLIPAGDVRQIDFATRVPDDVSKKIDAAIANLASNDFKTRETASAELQALAAVAYPALQKAAKNPDAEVARRVEELLDKIRQEVPEDKLEVRPYDVVHTEHSKIAGRIPAGALKVATAQFGELSMKLADVRRLGGPGRDPEDDSKVPVEANTDSVMNYGQHMGKSFRFRVTGGINGAVWGTDVYTGDSSLSTVAVHAGLLKPGQTGVVKVTILPSPPVYTGSCNGVTSMPYNAFPFAFKVSR